MAKYKNYQEFLNQFRSNKDQIELINLEKSESLFYEESSNLIINGYHNLKIIKRGDSFIHKANRIIISNCPKLESIDISSSTDTEKLILFNLPRLVTLNCSNCKLSELNLYNLNNLKRIDCYENFLREIHFPDDSSKLETLWIMDNNFPEQNLSIFSSLTNLKYLDFGNRLKERIDQGIYNRFFGSLESLRELKLERLGIWNTRVDNGIQFLQNNLTRFNCNNIEIIKLIDHKDSDDIFERTKNIKKNFRKIFNGWSDEEVDKLREVEKFISIKNFVNVFRWSLRCSSTIGGSLLLAGGKEINNPYTKIGGIISIIVPFVEIILSSYENRLNKISELEWDRFVLNSEDLWNDYQELIESKILEKEFNFLFDNEILSDWFVKNNNENLEDGIFVTKKEFARNLRDNWSLKRTQWKYIIEKLNIVCKIKKIKFDGKMEWYLMDKEDQQLEITQEHEPNYIIRL